MHTGSYQAVLAAVACCLISGAIAGCGAGAGAQGERQAHSLNSGYRALEAKNYEQAMSASDAHLRANPRGAGAAEALYLRGRALEERGAASPQEAQRDYAAARAAYSQALAMGPSPQLEGHIRAGVANIAYWSDDYSTAISQWRSAYERLDQTDAKAWTLYRIGLSQQRLGQFEEADRTFAQVQQRYAGTLPAQRAGERVGSRSFSVQVAVFSTPAAADNAVASIRQQGAPVQKSMDVAGRQVVRVGPVPSYQQARVLRERFAGAFPDAFIIP
jgi:tetratricopeptide (TPR) repeat protein